jgi:RNA-binding protein YlmH
MDNNELIRRAEDLSARCDKTNSVTNTPFLTPAEQYGIHSWAQRFPPDCRIVFDGGRPECERRAAFFLPYYLEAEDFDASEYIRAIKVTAGFGMPGHRDYMGAALGLGVKREWLGDIWVIESEAFIFCMPSVEEHLLLNLDKVGRFGVKTGKIALADVPVPERKVIKVAFTVMSMRLDAVAAGMFSVSRTEAARLVEEGRVSLNYAECLRTDAGVKEGDVISVRGFGKGEITAMGGTSRRGRQFVNAEIYM